jgi:spore germination protein YaaH
MGFCVCVLLAVCRSGPAAEGEPLEEAAVAEAAESLPEGGEEPPPLAPAELPVSSFGEIWAYLVAGREESFSPAFPLSDIGYFGAEIDSYGRLTGAPDRKKLAAFRGRVHLVVACNSRGLTHFALEEGSATRRRLVADLLAAARDYDGLQIDFELVPARDGGSFRSFLAELRAGLGGKLFTIALPARRRTLEDDVYDYRRIRDLVDRILVMAYDEHWATSEPGPIASPDWCRAVAGYSLSVAGADKLIMGLPFYGRTWGDLNPNRAFFFSGIERIRGEQNIGEIRRENGIPTFTYETPLKITAYYEDVYSLSARLEMYRSMGVKSVGFWCLGQEDPAVWDHLSLEGG